mmetsp:Transcript_55314/g.129453  ORF Transcript_55314/g.129453 Transcript_55314/m.129453 type:complete len:227 (+) Transcript_55314:171-851(+)
MGIGTSTHRSEPLGAALRAYEATLSEEESEGFAQHLQDANIEIACFDMDLTMVAQHSMGRMKRGDPLEQFLSNIRTDFVRLVPKLHQRSIKLAVATHSDAHEYNWLLGVREESHILGEELAKACLARACPEIAEEFFVVAYNPTARLGPLLPFQPHMRGKRHHIRSIMKHYGCTDASRVVLFDDDEENVRTVPEGCHAVKVDPKIGFCLRGVRFEEKLKEEEEQER